ncbi:MAG TPA: HemK/PrmC family methyltransferase, partial [Rubrobacteraceae bacterium]|nr:HemK/PrmC family methyltransferase [Rubrobacteraceae bacterium]
DTEGVVDAVLGAVDARGGACRVLDLGTGSGAIAIAVAQERPRCEVHASDSSEGALRVARRNAVLAGTAACFHAADLASGLDHLAGSVEVLVSNPPYIRTGDLPSLAPEVRDWEPHAALDGGPGGLDFYHRIFAEVPPLLAEGAEIMLEVGDGQNEAVLELGGRAGFEPLGARTDLAGCPRVVVLRWRPQG